jgi:hypothetical protein
LIGCIRLARSASRCGLPVRSLGLDKKINANIHDLKDACVTICEITYQAVFTLDNLKKIESGDDFLSVNARKHF